MKTKLLIPVILATVMMIGATFAIAPVEKASTVHTTILNAIAGTGSGNNLINRASNSTFKETVRGFYEWTVSSAASGSSNGTLLINFANAGTPGGTAPTKVTGFLSAANRNATQLGTLQGGLVVYSGNGTGLLAAVKSTDAFKSAFITLGGTGLDVRANESQSQTGSVKFQVVKVD